MKADYTYGPGFHYEYFPPGMVPDENDIMIYHDKAISYIMATRPDRPKFVVQCRTYQSINTNGSRGYVLEYLLA